MTSYFFSFRSLRFSLLMLAIMTLGANNLYASDLDDLIVQDKNAANQNDIRPSDVIQWQVWDAVQKEDGSVEIKVSLETKGGFTLYREKVMFTSPLGYLLSSIDAPDPVQQKDPLSEEEVWVYQGGTFTLTFTGTDDYKSETFPLSIKFLGCSVRICLFPHTEKFVVPLKLFKKHAKNATNFEDTEKLLDYSTEKDSIIEASDSESRSFDEKIEELAQKINDKKQPLWLLLILLLIGGVLTNVTPCVYPMIPITVSILKNQSKLPLLASAAYALGITLTYTLLGIVASATGSMFGNIMANIWVNLFFAVIMFLFTLSMLGYGNWSFVQKVGQQMEVNKRGYLNALAMGMGAGLVASPCTGPVLASLLTFTTSRGSDFATSTLMFFTYSVGFGLPYLFLGTASQKIAGWKMHVQSQLATKIIFAAIMFSLFLYYLRVPFYEMYQFFIPYWHTILWIHLVVGFFALILVLLRSEFYFQKKIQLIPTIFLGIGVFAFSQWLSLSQAKGENGELLKWHKDLSEAISVAEKSKAPILIDMWAEWCEACKKMERTTFADQKVIDTLKQNNWVLVKLDLTLSTEETDRLQEQFEIFGLPTLVLIPPVADIENKENLTGYITAKTLLENLNKFHP